MTKQQHSSLDCERKVSRRSTGHPYASLSGTRLGDVRALLNLTRFVNIRVLTGSRTNIALPVPSLQIRLRAYRDGVSNTSLLNKHTSELPDQMYGSPSVFLSDSGRRHS